MQKLYIIVTLVKEGEMLKKVQINRVEALQMYEMMLRIRLFEKEVERNVQKGYLHGTTHLYNGQEAIAVGVCSQLEKGDLITSTHRGHGHAIAMGASLHKMMAEMFGKVTGYSKGKGGSMHIANLEDGNLGSNGVVGGNIPIAVGAALTLQMKEKPNVVVCFFGDGAANEGSFHEALNLASIWKVPVIFVCENNVYGMSSAITEMTRIEQLSIRAKAYGFPGVTIDGNNLFSVTSTIKEAIERARYGAGPTLIEAKTYRFKGHSRSDKEKYRTKEEVAFYKQSCPIRRFEHVLLEEYKIEPGVLNQLYKKIKTEVKEATAFALESELPLVTSLEQDVYADE